MISKSKAEPRYEVQIRHATYGWSSAGNWPARTIEEGRKSLRECVSIYDGHDYRLVRLRPVVIEKIKARKADGSERT